MKQGMYKALAAGLVWLMAAGAAEAADTLDTVYVDANKNAYAGGYLSAHPSVGMLPARDIMETPMSVISVTDTAIKDFAIAGNNEIMDILTLSPSVRRTTSPNIVAMRGKQVSASQMNINGVPGMYSNFSMGTNFIGAMDILSGPALVYTGSTANSNVIGGTVNLRTKEASHTPNLDLGIRYTGKSHFRETVDFGKRFGAKEEWGIRVNALTADGELAVHDEKLKQRNIFVNIDHKGEKSDSNLFMGYAYSKHNGGNSIFQTTNNRPASPTVPFLPGAPRGSHNLNPGWAYTENRSWVMTFNHEQHLNEHWTAFLNAGIVRSETPVSMSASAMTSILKFGADGSFDGTFSRPMTLSASANTNRYIGGGLKAKHDFGFMKNELLIGFDRNSVKNLTSSSVKLGTFTGNLYTDNDWAAPAWTRVGARLGNKYETKGITIIDTMKFLDDDLIVNVGLHRHSYRARSYNASGAVSSRSSYDGDCPTYGFVYRITPKVSVYANHAETFLGGAQVPTNKGYANGGELLDPAKTKSNEFGVKWQNGKLLHTLAFYRTKEPGVVVTSDNYYKYDGETTYKGIELSTAGSISNKLDFIAGIGFTRYVWGRNNSNYPVGQTANGIPKWTGNLALAYHPNEQWTILGRANYIGTSKICFGAYEVPSYLRFDIGVKYETTWNKTPVTLSAMCYNVADKKGWFTADQGNQLLAGDPRTFVLSADFRL